MAKEPQDSGSQVDLEKTRAQLWTRGLDDSEPEQPENYQLSKVSEPNQKIVKPTKGQIPFLPANPVSVR